MKQIRGFSIITKLRNEKKINEEFEIMFHNLTLEEIITLKLELLGKLMFDRPHGIDVWRTLERVLKIAVLMWTYTRLSTKEGALFLGYSTRRYKQLLREYKLKEIYKDLLTNKKYGLINNNKALEVTRQES